MRRARITYPGAFHHVMNRGYAINDIFRGNQNKNQFLDYLADASKKLKIRILAYCIMDTHYHLVLENSSGKMSEFRKRLDGIYGSYYRTKFGRHGYVFQNRYISTLIEKEAYLLNSILYLLLNPVQVGVVPDAKFYVWSSVNAYYSTGLGAKNDMIVDVAFIEELFGEKSELLEALNREYIHELPVRKTKYGEFLGSDNFLRQSIQKFDRRQIPTDQSLGKQRIDDLYFEPVEKVLMGFESIHGVDIEEIDIKSLKGKRLRGELLVLLIDYSGLTYKEISELDFFSDLASESLRGIYRNMKNRKSQRVG